MTDKELMEAAITRGETLESMGAGKASTEDLEIYIEDIGRENGLSNEQIERTKRNEL